MKKRILFSVLVVVATVFVACKSDSQHLSSQLVDNPISYNSDAAVQDIARIAFDTTVYDFGKLLEGEIVKYTFRFSNTGTKDLLISSVKTSCGCTASEYPIQAIKPGETSQIVVKFDSKNRSGFQNKTITVNTNSVPASYILRIKANVIDPIQ